MIIKDISYDYHKFPIDDLGMMLNIGLDLVLINIVLSINISMSCLFYPISLLRSTPVKGSNFGSGPGKSPRKSWKS